MDFYQLLQNIRKRPTLYLSRCSIVDLQTFCNAYQLSRRDLDIPESDQEKEFLEFSSWLRHHWNITTNNHSWASLILFHSSLEHDERAALQTFFELWDKFLAERQLPPESSRLQDLVTSGN
jgi:hypothetical protein